LKIVHPHTCTQIGISGSFGGCALRWPVEPGPCFLIYAE
jgi:hypothetical protein